MDYHYLIHGVMVYAMQMLQDADLLLLMLMKVDIINYAIVNSQLMLLSAIKLIEKLLLIIIALIEDSMKFGEW